jgi:hypothetical protein
MRGDHFGKATLHKLTASVVDSGKPFLRRRCCADGSCSSHSKRPRLAQPCLLPSAFNNWPCASRTLYSTVQYDYEVIRGIFLGDETIAARSRETGLDRATVAEKARRFLEHGMLGLTERRTTYASPHLELWELDDAQWRKSTICSIDRKYE